MANDLVVKLGARLDQFAADMDQAGDIADSAVGKIESSFAKLNPGINIGGLTAVIAGAAAGFSALLAVVQQLNKGLDDMAKQAERIGLSTKRFQELQFAGSALGVKDIGAGLETFSQNVQTSLSRVNDLKRVFDANGQTITDSNGKIRDMGKLLDTAFDIVKRAPSIGDALQIGTFLGFSREFSQELFRAGDQFQSLAREANAVGAVIDDATVQKASQFTTEWNRAAAIWGVQMKASITEWLPLLNDAIQVARTLIGYVGTVTSALGAVKDFAIAPNVDEASLSKLQQLNDQYQSIRDTLEKGDKLNPIQLFQASNIQEQGEVTVEAVDKALVVIRDRILNFNKDRPRVEIFGKENASVNPGLKPQGGEGRDQFESAVDQITRRTSTLRADTATTFENTAAQAQLRAEYTLLNAIVRDGGEVSQEQLRRYEELRQSMSATQALQASGITLTEQHAAAFKTASEGIAQATAEHTKARERLSALNSASQQFGSALSNSFADAVLEGKNLNEVLNQLLKSLARMAINSAFQSFFAPGGGGGVSPFLSFLGIGRNAEGTNNWRGGLSWVGEKGPELVNLPRGAQVIPNAVATKMGGGSSFAPSYYINAAGADTGTVARIEQVLMQHARAIAQQNSAMTRAQRMQSFGVG